MKLGLFFMNKGMNTSDTFFLKKDWMLVLWAKLFGRGGYTGDDLVEEYRIMA